jgi:hypothetical protein
MKRNVHEREKDVSWSMTMTHRKGANSPLEHCNKNIMQVCAWEGAVHAAVGIIFRMGTSKMEMRVLVFLRSHHYLQIWKVRSHPHRRPSHPFCHVPTITIRARTIQL